MKFSFLYPSYSSNHRGRVHLLPAPAFLKVAKAVLLALFWLAVVAAVEWKVMQDIGEGRIQAGPVSRMPLEEVRQRMEFHGALVARLGADGNWYFIRQGRTCRLW